MYRYLIPFCVLLVTACTTNEDKGDKPETTDVASYDPVDLPDDLNQIPDSCLLPILPMLGDAKIIGLSEGTHGMIEPIQFRNELLKFLIEQGRIGVVAIESGTVESKLAYDYVNGADIDIDTVLQDGIVCGFGGIDLNRDLLVWLRNYNQNKPKERKVHFYGYDIPGCAPNPVLENALVGFEYLLEYLAQVDSTLSTTYRNRLAEYMPLLRIKDSQEDIEPHFTDMDSLQWFTLLQHLDQLEEEFSVRKKSWIGISGSDQYDWARQALIGARQNTEFLHSIGNEEYPHSPRELGQMENIKWIMKREPDRRVAIFAHLGHIAKELHMHGEREMLPMGGEYLSEEFNKDYVVIGNFYGKLDWFDDDPIVLGDSTVAGELRKYNKKNFYMKLDKSDSIWQREWPFGKPSSGGQVYMNPSLAVDIVLFNEVQTWLDHYQEDE